MVMMDQNKYGKVDFAGNLKCCGALQVEAVPDSWFSNTMYFRGRLRDRRIFSPDSEVFLFWVGHLIKAGMDKRQSWEKRQ
jgi:hypothetical protein